jgi:2-dehydropantoate 2-reductase
MGGLCFVCINQTAPGVIEHYAQGLITIGELSGPPLPRTLALADLFAQAGIPCKAIDSLDAARWRKLVWNIPFNGLAIAAGGIDTSQILASPPLEQLARDLMAEVIETASHLGHKFPEGLIDDQIARTKTMGSYQPSSLIDWKNGRSVEIDAIWQLPCQVAMESGQPMPRVGVLLRLLQHLAHPDHA